MIFVHTTVADERLADCMFEGEELTTSKRNTATRTSCQPRLTNEVTWVRSALVVAVLFLRASSVCLDFFVSFASRQKGQEDSGANCI